MRQANANQYGLSSVVLPRARPRASGEADDDTDGSIVVKERPADPQVKPPPMYKVILLNDDYTPQEFVVHVLMKFFYMDFDKAERLMLLVHTTGSAVIAIYPRDIAETKSEQVNHYAQENNYPLKSAVEQTDED
ncbi:MAG: ATP-dependent Clp protease adapter ClpS [Pseudomonadales bacterium]|nr:ATP-dependent Clp protease adapter ClpS [Pseudomonadales bacterium]